MNLSRAPALPATEPHRKTMISQVRKLYRAPAFSQLYPDEAKKKLLLARDGGDPAVQQMLDWIKEAGN